MIEIIAEAQAAISSGLTGNIHVALGCLGAALGVAMVGAKAVDAVGRNPGASSKILTIPLALAQSCLIPITQLQPRPKMCNS